MAASGGSILRAAAAGGLGHGGLGDFDGNSLANDILVRDTRSGAIEV
jgi:hypothetical protein